MDHNDTILQRFQRLEAERRVLVERGKVRVEAGDKRDLEAREKALVKLLEPRNARK